MKTVTNTWFTVLEFDENNENERVLFSELKRSTTVPFSLLCAFKGLLGRNVKFTMWTEGNKEVTVLGRGGKMSFKFKDL